METSLDITPPHACPAYAVSALLTIFPLSRYPTRFYINGPNAANWNIPSRLANSNRLMEFPIFRNAQGGIVLFQDGDDQGPDRVVFDGATNQFAGVFTHRGEINNNFHQAPGHNQDINAPRYNIDFGPSTIDMGPFNWFSGGGNDGFPLRRSPVLPPASFPTTHDGCPLGDDGLCYCYNTVTVEGWFPKNAAAQAITQACSEWAGVKVPLAGSSTNPKTLSTTKQITYNNTVWSIEMSVWQILLVTAPASTVDKASCVAALNGALNDCQTNTIDKKIGGEWVHDIPHVGSQLFVIHPGSGNVSPSLPT